jgi:glucan 1,4-alpha-glucosidase
MTKINVFLIFTCIALLLACNTSKKVVSSPVNTATTDTKTAVPVTNPIYNNETGIFTTSPNTKTRLSFKLTANGEPTYKIIRNNKIVIGDSKMGLKFFDSDFNSNFEVVNTEQNSNDQTWKPVWGEVAQIRDNHNVLTLHLKHKETQHLLDIIFKVYDDGVGFRYSLPEQEGWTQRIVTEETTEFQLMNDNKTFWIPGDYDSNEHVYSTTKVSAINNSEYRKAENSISAMELHNPTSVQTPFSMKNEGDGTYICIHEAALVNFPAMQLHVDNKTLKLTSLLVPSSFEKIKASIKVPFKSPWRTIILTDNAAGLLESKLILNLNDPNVLEDVSWIKPQKFVGVWWEMHLGTATWDYENSQNMGVEKGAKSAIRHGATTENTKKFIDFASKNGIDGVLVEGWNTGWKDWFGKMKDTVFSFTTPYPDYNIEEVNKYAASKGVKIICHHETSSAVTNYEQQMDDAYKYLKKYGMNSIKSGYVGKIIPRGEHHDGQWMINHYMRVMQKTAENKIMIDMHEPVRPTGLHRTYPNFLACEAARGNEFNAWSRGNAPEHETILPFTRLMGGPMDYTPGIFKTSFENLGKKERVHTTLTKQLALYVTMYSPIQMAADLVENYEARPKEFQFIKDVAVDWDDTKILNAEIGDYITIARKAKGKNEWYIGSITDEMPRNFSIKLDFLKAGKKYKATIYADAADAHWEKNPTATNITEQTVDKNTVLALKLVAGGGTAISLKEIQ